MTEYISEYLDFNDGDARDVNDELDKPSGEQDNEILNMFYSYPVKIWNDEPPQNSNDYHWQVLLTREQYDQRVADGKDPKDFTNCDVKYKKEKKDKPGEYNPRHTFGRFTNIPAEKQ